MLVARNEDALRKLAVAAPPKTLALFQMPPRSPVAIKRITVTDTSKQAILIYKEELEKYALKKELK